MKPLSIKEIKSAVRGTLENLGLEDEITGISTDSRNVAKGDLFVALDGERFDGHGYLKDAFAKGATGAVISRSYQGSLPDGGGYIRVRDTYDALGSIAKMYRSKLQATVIAVTGSNGKTTTKAMIAHLLGSGREVAVSPKSFNNRVGVPLTIFSMDTPTEYAVIELGASAPREIYKLGEIAAPQIGAIVSIGRAHLEGFQDIEGVARAKAELLGVLGKRDTAILNIDDAWCRKLLPRVEGKCVTVGTTDEADLFISSCEQTADGLEMEFNGKDRLRVPVLGRHFTSAVAVAVAVCRRLGMEMQDIAERFESFQLPPMRMQRITCRNVRFINDAYNANPDSMIKAVEALSEMPACRMRVLVAGGMLELGPQAVALHRETGEAAGKIGLDCVLTIGPLAKELGEACARTGGDRTSHVHVEDVQEAANWLASNICEDDVVLLKGSRQAAVERVLELFEKQDH